MIVLNPVLFAAMVSSACGASSPTAPSAAEVCSGYADWTTSAYVLPYAAGETYRVAQGNCSPPGNGHRGSERYGYDFEMPIDTPFIAIRGGTITHIEEGHFDGQVAVTGLDNYIVVRHEDSTFALYGHLTHDGAVVSEGDTVEQSQLLGFSGNTGNTNNFAHLHVSVHACDPVTRGSAACPTQPITFRNTDPNPAGLQVTRRYEARKQ